MTPARCRKVNGKGQPVRAKLRTEAPVNGGRKDIAAPRKQFLGQQLCQMLETPCIRRYSLTVTPHLENVTVSSDNPTGAVNQQERPSSSAWLDAIPPDVGHYIAGFVDGEGSFNVPIRRSTDRGLPWRVGLSFNVSQVGTSAARSLLEVFGVGTMRSRTDGVTYYEVTKPGELKMRVIPFFERFPLRLKNADLAIFITITELVLSGRHLSSAGIIDILTLRAPMNRGGKRRYSDDQIIQALREWESSETIRRAPRLKRGDEDMVHAL